MMLMRPSEVRAVPPLGRRRFVQGLATAGAVAGLPAGTAHGSVTAALLLSGQDFTL